MKGKRIIKAILMTFVFAFPISVFLCLVIFKLPISIMSLGMLIVAASYFAFSSGTGKRNWNAIILAIIAIVVLVTKSEIVLKFYPICITFVFLVLFCVPLLQGHPIIMRFALMMDPVILVHPGRGIIERCCKWINVAWCIHFILSLAVNIFIVFGSSLEIWTIYNAFVSYVIQFLLISIMIVSINICNAVADRKVRLDMLVPNARPDDYVLGFYGLEYDFRNSGNKTWKDLFDTILNIASKLPEGTRVTINCKDRWNCFVSVVCAYCTGKTAVLTDSDVADVTDAVLISSVPDEMRLPFENLEFKAHELRVILEKGDERKSLVFEPKSLVSEVTQMICTIITKDDGDFCFLVCPNKRKIKDMVKNICER